MFSWLRVPLLVKYFIGIALVQGVTVLLIYVWLQSGETRLEATLSFAALGLVSSLFAALWFSSMAGSEHKVSQIRAEAMLARERERHRRQAERERVKAERAREKAEAKATASARRETLRETQKTQNRSHLKMSGAVVGMAGLGAVLVVTQLMSLGLLVLSAAGGTLAGYFLRMRHESRRNQVPAATDHDRLASNPQNQAPRLLRGVQLLPGQRNTTSDK